MLVYRLGPAHFLLVVNAANMAKDYAWIVEQAQGGWRRGGGRLEQPLRADRACRARRPWNAAAAGHGVDIERSAVLRFTHGEVASARALISRTGYTGEDGFEIFVPPNTADRVWQALLESGPRGRRPCGLGARDTLRLEAACGSTATTSTRPPRRSRPAWAGLSAGTSRRSSARACCAQQKAEGPTQTPRRLRDDRARHRPPRAIAVLRDGARVGT